MISLSRRHTRSSHFCASITVLVILAATCPSWAVLPFVLSTNSSGNLSAGNTWVGSGTIQSNVIPTSFTANGLQNPVLISGFSSGNLTIVTGNLFPAATPPPGGRFYNTTGVSHRLALTGGGTANLHVANSASFDGGDLLFNSVGLSGFSGNVTKIVWTIDYTLPIAGRNDTTTGLDNRPMGAALGLVNAGSGLTPSQYAVTMTLGGVSSDADSNGTFTPGVPANARPFASAGWAGTSISQAGATTFSTDAGFDGTVPLGNSSTNFLLIRGYDVNGSGNNYTVADSNLVYVKSVTFEITRIGGGAFAANTAFTISMDGQQYTNVNNAIPEPSAGVLLGLATIGALLGWRRCRAA